MKKAVAIFMGSLLFISGCVGLQAGHMPDDTSAHDRQNIAQHARAYWDRNREVETYEPPIRYDHEEYGISEEENNQIDSYMEGFSSAIKRIKKACITDQSFSIDNLRYGCMPLRERGDPNGFSTGQ